MFCPFLSKYVDEEGMNMKKTKHFNDLEVEFQKQLLNSTVNDHGFLFGSYLGFTPLSATNRSSVFTVYNDKYILKVLRDNGKNDNDIGALLALDGIKYFPKLFAYKEKEYLLMEKAKGISLPKLIIKGVNDMEIDAIKEQLLDAYSLMIGLGYKDWDFKLEHIFWDRKNERLTWIDLGICEEYKIDIPSKDELIKNFEKRFLEELERINN